MDALYHSLNKLMIIFSKNIVIMDAFIHFHGVITNNLG